MHEERDAGGTKKPPSSRHHPPACICSGSSRQQRRPRKCGGRDGYFCLSPAPSYLLYRLCRFQVCTWFWSACVYVRVCVCVFSEARKLRQTLSYARRAGLFTGKKRIRVGEGESPRVTLLCMMVCNGSRLLQGGFPDFFLPILLLRRDALAKCFRASAKY